MSSPRLIDWGYESQAVVSVSDVPHLIITVMRVLMYGTDQYTFSHMQKGCLCTLILFICACVCAHVYVCVCINVILGLWERFTLQVL